MYCFNRGCKASEIEKDDNFCYLCGHWTAKGYIILKEENGDVITDGPIVKQNNRLHTLWILFSLFVIIFFLMFMFRKENLFKPFFYLKKEVLSYNYGYKVTLLKDNNKYSDISVKSDLEAKELIKKDFNSQSMYCFNNFAVDKIGFDIEKNYDIPSVMLCDISELEAKKIEEVINKIYVLFPNIKGTLTNITITNAKKDYIAKFQPVNQFVNVSNDINLYNKVNKTQILLNGYYFLNEDILSKKIDEVLGSNKYVKDSTWESEIAHEFGHYISFLTLLKEKNIKNVLLVTKDNYKDIDNIINEVNRGDYSNNLVLEAKKAYSTKYGDISLDDYAGNISLYAKEKNESGKIISEEVVAEAVHDYFLHGDDMTNESKEIINILKTRLSR